MSHSNTQMLAGTVVTVALITSMPAYSMSLVQTSYHTPRQVTQMYQDHQSHPLTTVQDTLPNFMLTNEKTASAHQ